ncbi:MAG TPA: cytochrome c peroxidase [Nitrospirota bacterium]|nr:cytochrome c peroxidase [Nitrospirota bacterium]
MSLIRLPRSNTARIFSLLPAILATLTAFGTTLFAASPDSELISRAAAIFGPLPESMPSPDNPITPEKVKLGRILFWEPRISSDRTVSCAKCHPPGLYAEDGLRKALGNHCKGNPRNSPTLLNAAAQISEHWIGNRTSVEDQAKQALIGPPSYGMPDYASVEKILRGMSGYRAMFKEAFPGEKEPVTADNFAKAVGAFERTFITPAPFDEFMRGNAAALTDQQKRGLRTFLDTGCMTCHLSPYLGGQMYQKFGVVEPYEKYTKSAPVDEGRFAVTKNPADKFFFKVPVLRNVAQTPPYFHDGSVDRLSDAVMIMARIQLGKDLAREPIDDIAAFLGSLTGRIPDALLSVPVLPSEQE